MSIREMDPLFEEQWLELKADPFAILRSNFPNLSDNAEIKDLERWYEERVNSRPSMDRTPSPLTNTKDWAYEYAERKEAENLEIEAVYRPDGNFYRFVGVKIIKYKEDGSKEFEWIQPIKKAEEKELTIDLLGEVRTLPFNGILAIIPDDEGNALFAAEQEATAETPSQQIVRLPVQASAGKVALMIGIGVDEARPNADKPLAELLEIYDVTIFELLEMAEVKILPPAEDTNLDIKHNILLVLPSVPAKSELHSKLVADSKRKWLSRVQQSALGHAGITNSHALAAIQLAGSYTLLKGIDN